MRTEKLKILTILYIQMDKFQNLITETLKL